MNKPQLHLPLDGFGRSVEVWRPIHYLGSKLRLVEALGRAIDHVDPARGRCVDLFAGSGTLSAAVAATRDVTAVDIQEYSRVLCSAVLLPPVVSDAEVEVFVEAAAVRAQANRIAANPLIQYEQSCLAAARAGDPEPICELIEHASMVAFAESRHPVRSDFDLAHGQARRSVVSDRTSTIVRYYGGLFFSYRQAAELDALLTLAHGMPAARRDFYLGAIISTASEVVNTVGKHFAQPIRPRGSDGRPKQHLVAKIIRDREIDLLVLFASWLDRYRLLPRYDRVHQAIRGDYAEVLPTLKDVSVVYADPPYTRDHYSRFYHVLETMCWGDDPGISTTRIRSPNGTYSRGMYRADRHQSPFCIMSQAPDAFRKLFAAVRAIDASLVLSYSPFSQGVAHPRVMTVEQIETLAKEYFKSVEVKSAGRISHMKLNASRLHLDASTEAELIFICR